MALMAFRRKDTQDALVQLGKDCLEHWASRDYQRDNPGFKVEGDKSKVKEYVKTFTEGITNTPPIILVDPKLVGAWASHSRRADYNGNFEVLQTRKLFRIKVPAQLIEVCTLAHFNAYTRKGPKLIASKNLPVTAYQSHLSSF